MSIALLWSLEKARIGRFPTEEFLSAVIGKNTRQSFRLLVGVTLTVGTGLLGELIAWSLTNKRGGGVVLGLLVGGILSTYLLLRWQQSQEESPDAIKGQVNQLASELRSQVQSRSYGARRNLIEAPLKELNLDITPRVGLVRDPRLTEPELISEETADDIVVAFESSKRRLLIVGEPGAGKTMAAYSLIEYLDRTEGAAGRIPLLEHVMDSAPVHNML